MNADYLSTPEFARLASFEHRSRGAAGSVDGVCRMNKPRPQLVAVAAVSCGDEHADRLARRVIEHARLLRTHLLFELGAPVETDGMLTWDSRLAEYLDGLGERGRELAAKVREKSTGLIAAEQASMRMPWYGDPAPAWWLWGLRPLPVGCDDIDLPWWADDGKDAPPWVLLVASAVWVDEVRLIVEREDRRISPALPMELHRKMAGLRRHRVENGALRSDGTTLVPLVPADLLAGLPGLQILGGLLVGRVVDWFAAELFLRDVAGDASNQVEVIGGWSGWAELVSPGASKKTPDQLHALADVLVRTTVDFNAPGAYGTMALLGGFVLKRGTAGRPSVLRLDLSQLFRPNLVHLLTGGERRLVPVVQLPPDAFSVLGPNLHPAADRLHRLAVAALVEGARALLSHGGVEIPWPRLAGEAGLGVEHLPPLLTSWTWWERVGASRWRLREGVGYDRVIAFLREGGELSRKGEARGKASAAKRRGKRR